MHALLAVPGQGFIPHMETQSLSSSLFSEGGALCTTFCAVGSKAGVAAFRVAFEVFGPDFSSLCAAGTRVGSAFCADLAFMGDVIDVAPAISPAAFKGTEVPAAFKGVPSAFEGDAAPAVFKGSPATFAFRDAFSL